jgi:MAGUK p55 subfamily member 3/7
LFLGHFIIEEHIFKDTTRPCRQGEIPGREYLFVSREKMEADIANGKFIEHGEFRGQLYGTSTESVKTIINAGSVCIINPHWGAIKALRTNQLKPYIVFIKPPLFEDLKSSRLTTKAISSHDETSSRGFTDEELHEMVKSSEKIELLYGHFFDEIIVNQELHAAFEEFFETVNRSENEPTWTPAAWCN